MVEEIRRYFALQRDQKPLAALLVYLKRSGGPVQLNRIWKDLGPAKKGPFWNQTTLINKLKKLALLGILREERRIVPSSTGADKRKTGTFFCLDNTSPLAAHIFCMLEVKKGQDDRFFSQLADRPLDRLLAEVSATPESRMMERQLAVAIELLGEVFGAEEKEVRVMIKERLAKSR